LIISKNWSQIKRRAKVILKLNSNKLRELHWIAEKTHALSIRPAIGFHLWANGWSLHHCTPKVLYNYINHQCAASKMILPITSQIERGRGTDYTLGCGTMILDSY